MTTFDRLSGEPGTRPRPGILPAVCLIMAVIGAQSSVAADTPGPRLAGWMQNFEPAVRPVPLPERTFVDEDGSRIALKEFGGRLTLVNFWATWCGPCVREMPSLDRLQAGLRGEDFVVVALSEDREGWRKIAPFRDRLKLRNLRLLHDEGSTFMFEVGVRGLPTTLLVGQDGRELGRLVGPAEWDAPEAVALIRHYLDQGNSR